jgi:hypothetical protein
MSDRRKIRAIADATGWNVTVMTIDDPKSRRPAWANQSDDYQHSDGGRVSILYTIFGRIRGNVWSYDLKGVGTRIGHGPPGRTSHWFLVAMEMWR